MCIPRIVKGFAALIGGVAGFLWGEMDGVLLALITCILLDYISGLIVGAVQHRLNSQIGFVGLAKKAFIMIVVALAHILDTQIFGGDKAVLRSAACFLYIANEGLSILENGGKIGVPYPAKLKAVLEQLHEKGEKDDQNISQ